MNCIKRDRKQAKERFDKEHSNPHKYNVGEFVLVENEASSTGMSRKLEPRYKGPFIITKFWIRTDMSSKTFQVRKERLVIIPLFMPQTN